MTTFAPIQGSPGWFDDPSTPGVSRYWDGQQWTGRTFGDPLPQPGAPPVPGPPGAPVFVPSTERGPRPGATTDSGAIRALVLALIGCLWGIPAIIEGGKARRRIRYSGGALKGDGLALAAVIIGWTWVALSIVSIGLAVLGTSAQTEPTYTPITTVPR